MGNSQITGGAQVSSFYRRETWIEGRAEDQLHQVAAWPGMRALAAFPDLHPGRYGPVGAAFLADRIYPQLVGPDIGCGMALFKLDLPRRKLRLDKAARRLRMIEEGLSSSDALTHLTDAGLEGRIGAEGLGSIGGGNHFVELQEMRSTTSVAGLRNGDLCLLVHSGSRGHGASVFNGIEETWRDGFLPGSEQAEAYLTLHDTAMAWARLNRQLLADMVGEALRTRAHLICDSSHNMVSPWDGSWLHRKGAACPDQGLVPLAGSRDSQSLLLSVAGLDPAALGSVSHGAGRKYDRASMHGRVKRNKSTLEAMCKTRFGGQVICEDRDLMIEESGAAYKDAGQVAADLEHFGLARTVAQLTPLLTYKKARKEHMHD